MSGKPGHTGPTGATGRKGLQGTPYGAPGTTFYSPTGRVNVTINADSSTVTFANAGGAYSIQASATMPTFSFPTNLTSNEYGTFWTVTNTFSGDLAQTIQIISGIRILQIPGSKLTCDFQKSPTPEFISLDIYQGQTIIFVYVAGSGVNAEYIAF